MTSGAVIQLVVFLALLLVLAWPVSRLIDAVMHGRVGWGLKVEAPLWRLAGVDAKQESGWVHYALGLLVFNGLGVLAVYALQRLQINLPLNPQSFSAVSPDSALNTAVSFVTNTNWQGYGGESTMSYLTQMLGLAVQNFLSAATGIVVVIALVRGFARHSSQAIGNVWVDLTRATLWILLPLSIVLALAFVGLGVVQTFSNYLSTTGLEGSQNSLALGPVASQLAIKMLGTNGGGFFNVNSAHPFENPNIWSNGLQMLAIFIIPAALCFVFGRMVGDRRQGWMVIAAMTVMFVGFALSTTWAEQQGNPSFAALGVDQTASATQPGGNMEGKEARFGINASTLFATITTAASCGAVNSMHDSYTRWAVLCPSSRCNWVRWCLAAWERASTACLSSRSWECSSPA